MTLSIELKQITLLMTYDTEYRAEANNIIDDMILRAEANNIIDDMTLRAEANNIIDDMTLSIELKQTTLLMT